jgi:hypothetical protein
MRVFFRRWRDHGLRYAVGLTIVIGIKRLFRKGGVEL